MDVPSPDVDLALLQAALDSLGDPIFVKDRAHRWIAFNDSFCKLLGRPRDQLLGRSDPDLFPPEQVAVFWKLDNELFRSGQLNENEEQLTDDEGIVHTIWTRKYPLFDSAGAVIGLVGVISDITALRDRLESIDALERTTAHQQLLIEAQQEVIDTMQVPVISVWDKILLVPLVGDVSVHRATLLLERLLDRLAREGARLVFIDLSGVPNIDESSAIMLQRIISTARLLGARVEVVGVSPGHARLIVEQGLDLRDVVAHRTLREGLRLALEAKSEPAT